MTRSFISRKRKTFRKSSFLSLSISAPNRLRVGHQTMCFCCTVKQLFKVASEFHVNSINVENFSGFFEMHFGKEFPMKMDVYTKCVCCFFFLLKFFFSFFLHKVCSHLFFDLHKKFYTPSKVIQYEKQNYITKKRRREKRK